MNSITRMDLDRLRIDSESFLGQAIALGIEFQKLPEHMAEAMLAYLRMKGTAVARRHRTGIAISPDLLGRSVRMLLVCLELGLEDASGGDLNAAVDLIARGDFEPFRKRGWEIAFFRLEEMQKTCRSLSERQEGAFLKPYLQDLRRWEGLVPGTWMGAPGEDEEEGSLVDPLGDYGKFQEVSARLAFMETLPRGSVADLQEAAAGESTFGDLLRHLVLSLALDLETLVPDPGQIADFQARCFEGGRMLPDVYKKVLGLMEGALKGEVEEERIQQQIVEEVEVEIGLLEGASEGEMAGFFVTSG